MKNVNKIDDKSKLEKVVENLNNFKKSLNKEANTTLADEEKLKSYNKTINDLISDYNDRIGDIKKAEEEAKKKAEEEAKAKEEAEATENQNNLYDNSYDSGSSNNTNYNSNDNNYSGGSSSGGSGNSNGNSSGSSGNSNNNSSNGGYVGNHAGCVGPDHGGLHHWNKNNESGITPYFYNDGYAVTSEGYEFNWFSHW